MVDEKRLDIYNTGFNDDMYDNLDFWSEFQAE